MQRSALSRPGRRPALAAVVAAATAVSVWAVATPTNPSAAAEDDDLAESIQQADDTLTTPFEQSDGARWTTVEEGQRFWRQLDASSDRVRVTTIGRTNENRPLQLVAVGDPAPASPQDAADGSVLMYTCSVHGDEPSGREACFQLARDMSTTTDPAWRRLLRDTTVLFLNVNPDGWKADTRENAQDLDVNRDYMTLASPEARAAVKTIRDWKPDVLNDLHEFGPNPYYRTDLLPATGRPTPPCTTCRAR
jgi:murein tripeptide amidase MpaA